MLALQCVCLAVYCNLPVRKLCCYLKWFVQFAQFLKLSCICVVFQLAGSSLPSVEVCDIGASMSVVCPTFPWKPSSIKVNLPVQQVSGEAVDGDAASNKPEISEDEIERARNFLRHECGCPSYQALSNLRGCSCGTPLTQVSTFGELDALFIEGTPCGCQQTSFCVSCSNLTPDESGSRCRNCNMEVYSIFVFTEIARRCVVYCCCVYWCS